MSKNILLEKTAKGLHREIIKYYPKKTVSSYLDVGSGSGALLKKLKKRYVKGYATDYSEENFSFKNKNIFFEQSDLNKNFPFKNKKFDVITCIEVIEHIENQFFLLREISKRMHSKSILILTSPNIYSVWSRFLFFFGSRFINYTDKDCFDHINPLIENIFESRVLKDVGLKVVKKKYFDTHIPLLDIYMPFRRKLFGNNVIYVIKKI